MESFLDIDKERQKASEAVKKLVACLHQTIQVRFPSRLLIRALIYLKKIHVFKMDDVAYFQLLRLTKLTRNSAPTDQTGTESR